MRVFEDVEEIRRNKAERGMTEAFLTRVFAGRDSYVAGMATKLSFLIQQLFFVLVIVHVNQTT